MSYTTIEAEINHGTVTVKEPDKLPEHGRAVLVVLPPDHLANEPIARPKVRAQLPLIRGDGTYTINPTAEELDASLWD